MKGTPSPSTLRSAVAALLILGVTASSLELSAFARSADPHTDNLAEAKASGTETKIAPSQTPAALGSARVSPRVTSAWHVAPPTAVARNTQAPVTPPETPKKKPGRWKKFLIVTAAAGAGVAVVAATKRNTTTPAATITFGQPTVGQPQ